MTPAPDDHARFDAQARRLHAAALAHLSPPTLARLRDARRGASMPERTGLASWLAGGAVAAAVALAVLLRPSPPTAGPAAPAIATAAPAAATATAGDPAGALQEDPGFYVWLDSVDATALAME